MTARRRGEKVRWRVIAAIEFAKAICRLLLLRLTNSRPLVSPPLPERETDPRAAEAEKEAAAGDWNGMDEPIEESSVSSSEISWTMPRTGLTLPSLPDASEISSYLISKVLTADDVKAPASLLHRVSGQGQFAEILYILRPVIYALAMQRWSKNKRSWSPWLIGFGLEYGSRQLAKRDLAERAAGGLRGLTGLERDELKKRGWSMGWWMMRGAFYENITRYVSFYMLSFLSLTLLDHGLEESPTSSRASLFWILLEDYWTTMNISGTTTTFRRPAFRHSLFISSVYLFISLYFVSL